MDLIRLYGLLSLISTNLLLGLAGVLTIMGILKLINSLIGQLINWECTCPGILMFFRYNFYISVGYLHSFPENSYSRCSHYGNQH